jgi:hypothetical protein
MVGSHDEPEEKFSRIATALCPFKDGADSHATGCAGRDQAAPGIGVLAQQFRHAGQYARTGGGEWVTHGNAAAFDVEFAAINAPERRCATEARATEVF